MEPAGGTEPVPAGPGPEGGPVPAAGGGGAGGAGGSGPGGPGDHHDGDDVQYLERWGVVIVALLVGAFMALMDASIVNVAIPAIERAFGVDTAQVEWIVTIYLLTLGVIVPTSGWLGDRLGFKRLYLLSMLVFIFGSALSAVAPSLPFLIIARVVQGLGGGMIMPTTMAMVYRLIPREKIGLASGVFGIGMLLAPAIGPTLGGYLVQFANWRWIFTINLPIGAVGLVFAGAVLPEFKARDAGPFDAWGFGTSATGLFALLLALSEGPSWGWHSEGITWLFFLSGVALLTFIWIELSVERPLLDMRVFRYGSFTASIVFIIGINIALFAPNFYIPVFLQLVRNLGAFQTGLILMPGALAAGVMMPIAGRLYDRVGPVPPVATGTVLLVLATYLMHRISLQTPSTTVAAWMAFRGLGMGMAMMPAMTAGMSVLPNRLIGRASATNNILSRVAASFGIAALTVLLDNGQAQRVVDLRAQYGPGTAHAAALQQLLGGLGVMSRAGITEVASYLQGVAFTHSLDSIFVALAGIGALTIVPVFFLRRGLSSGGTGRPGPGPVAAD